MFSPGILWSGFSLNSFGSFVQILQMYSYVRIPTKPALHSDLKPATDSDEAGRGSDLKPAT
jgi:hypothetical protein